jgi:hypothetical protein
MILGLMATACQTLTKEQCLTADWQEVGYEDGLKGLPIDYITSHQEACAKHKVVPLLEDYNLGRDKGLVSYCQPSNGFTQGREGVEYLAVCSSELELEFIPAYNQGRLIGDRERELTALLSVKRSLETELKNIDKRLDSRFIADRSRGESPMGVDLIILSESLQADKRELIDEIQLVTRKIDVLSKRIESMQVSIRFPM